MACRKAKFGTSLLEHLKIQLTIFGVKWLKIKTSTKAQVQENMDFASFFGNLKNLKKS
jgi:hypothetical protein